MNSAVESKKYGVTPKLRAKAYHIVTYGCQMNKSDSERIASIFEQYDCKPTAEPVEADFIVLNTCSVRQSAEDRVLGAVRGYRMNSSAKKDLKIILTGCMAPREDAVARIEGVDVVLAIKEIATLPQKLGLVRPDDSQIVADYFSVAPKYTNKFQCYIPIMTGCNNFCTFCVVPFTRGREYSRLMIDVLKEVETAVAQGAKEINLLGQNVNSYKYGFVELLKKINEIPGDFWVRFVSSNPQDMTTELLDTVANGEKLCKYIHFAVQSGNNRILKRMNRRHTIAQYLELYDHMKKVMPDVGVSTDIIVGFPSETREEHLDTLKLMEQVKFDMAYINQYSARSGTPSWRMKDDVSIEEKHARDHELTDLLKRTAKENNEKFVGRTIKVLIEKINRRGVLAGKDTGFRTVNVNSADESLVGTFVNVRILEALPFGMNGELVSE